jgi:8-oxo-dGTP pyrophosphatase MutT (NUDIX family)
METNFETPAKPPRAAATVVMLRDGPDGLEVFLLQRHGLSDVLGGAYVFPGGKVDLADAELDMDADLDQAPAALHAALGESDIDTTTAAGLYVAALREAFEECGVLFAQSAQGAREVDTAAAQALLREGHAFDEMLHAMGLRLQTRALLPWSRWITPVVSSVMNKRFDTRFFVAAMPAGQTALHDNRETTGSAWLRPRVALEQYRDRLIDLAPPQIMSLAHLARHATVQSVMDAARNRPPPVIQPEPFDHEGVRVLCYPGDARHSVRERALPGPSRLLYRNQRFEPADGFDALFD